MSYLRPSSINRKLTLYVMLTCGLTLLLAGAAFLLHDVVTMRSAAGERLSTIANLIATNSATALARGDAEAAGKTLAGLRANRHVVLARIFAADGSLFASYSGSGHRASVIRGAPPQTGLAQAGSNWCYAGAITDQGRTLGGRTAGREQPRALNRRSGRGWMSRRSLWTWG